MTAFQKLSLRTWFKNPPRNKLRPSPKGKVKS